MSASSPIRIPGSPHCPTLVRPLKRTYSMAIGDARSRRLFGDEEEASQAIVSESESSDGSDDGSSLEGFVVDDDDASTSGSSSSESSEDEQASCSVCDEFVCVCSDETQFGLDRAMDYSKSASFLVSLSEHTDVVFSNIVSNPAYAGFDDSFNLVEGMSKDSCIDRFRSEGGACKHMVSTLCDSCRLKNLRDLYYAKARLESEPEFSDAEVCAMALTNMRFALSKREFKA